VFPDLSGSTAVHDRYQNYDAFGEVAAPAVLRPPDLEDCAEAYPDAIWPGQAADALRALITPQTRPASGDWTPSPARRSPLSCVFSGPPSSPACRRSAAFPARKQGRNPAAHCWSACATARPTCCVFLPDLRIPPTSNQAGRDLRPAKTQQKISGRLRSEKAARDQYAIRGYASTAVKHGADALTATRAALAGNPWMPPVPESGLTAPTGSHAAQATITRQEWSECLRVDVPAFELPAEIADAGTIGIIYDEIGGLNFYNEYHRAEFSRGSFADMRGILPG
jgi:transposase